MTLDQIEKEALGLPVEEFRKLVSRLLAAKFRRDEAGWHEINRRLDDKNPDSWVSLDAAKAELLLDEKD